MELETVAVKLVVEFCEILKFGLPGLTLAISTLTALYW